MLHSSARLNERLDAWLYIISEPRNLFIGTGAQIL